MDMTKDELYQLKIQLDLGPYEKRLGRLQQSGREYRAWCPWHKKPGGPQKPVACDLPGQGWRRLVL